MKLRAGSMKRETKIVNPLPGSSRKKGGGFKSIKLEIKKREVTTDTTELQRILRDYYK